MKLGNLPAVSFKSNYKMPLNANSSDAVKPLYAYWNRGVEIYEHFDSRITSADSFGQMIIDADDKFDGKIEALLKANGIKFTKKSRFELMETNNIISRIRLSDSDKRYNGELAILNAEKVEELVKKDNSYYIKPGASNGIGNRYDDIIEYLKTGQDIDASTIHIREDNGKPVLGFIDGRHRFCVYRDMGIPNIPFALDLKSLSVAKKYGLLA